MPIIKDVPKMIPSIVTPFKLHFLMLEVDANCVVDLEPLGYQMTLVEYVSYVSWLIALTCTFKDSYEASSARKEQIQ